MTQDCSTTHSIADENKSSDNWRFPKGIHVTETNHFSGSGALVMQDSEPVGYCISSGKDSEEKDIPWGYIIIHNKQIEGFRKQMDAYNHAHPDKIYPCFVHYSYRFRQKSNGKGVIREYVPTVSGLVFLQGTTDALQDFLQANHPQYHLVNDCSTGKPASIENRIMQPFMNVITGHPEYVTFLRDPFEKFAKDHVKLRILTGLFKGMEGYIVRIDRNRQLVMDLGGYAVAIRGIHHEDFEVVE